MQKYRRQIIERGGKFWPSWQTSLALKHAKKWRVLTGIHKPSIPLCTNCTIPLYHTCGILPADVSYTPQTFLVPYPCIMSFLPCHIHTWHHLSIWPTPPIHTVYTTYLRIFHILKQPNHHWNIDDGRREQSIWEVLHPADTFSLGEVKNKIQNTKHKYKIQNTNTTYEYKYKIQIQINLKSTSPACFPFSPRMTHYPLKMWQRQHRDH